jgi:hypothetical protein
MRWFEIAYRLFCAGILAFFSYVPVLICFHTLRTVITEPAKFDLTFVLVFAGSAALAYFLLLLTYRAATGRGRKSDGGLLPPVVMKGLFLLFGLIAIGIVGMGIWLGELKPVVGGIGYLLIALAAWRRRRSQSDET